MDLTANDLPGGDLDEVEVVLTLVMWASSVAAVPEVGAVAAVEMAVVAAWVMTMAVDS